MGKLILILGCMFSSKSSKLLEYYYKYKLKYKCLLISHEKDTRYGENCVSTHNKFSAKSIALGHLIESFELVAYKQAKVILIDEGQFYPDILDFVYKSVNDDGKIVIISGLNGDFKKNPIGDILRLIPEADDIHFQRAICHYCPKPEDAIFSLRTNSKIKDQVAIGEKELYVPVCRYHYNQKNKN